MENKYFKLINIEEYYHAKFQRKIYKIRLCPVKIDKDRDGYEYSFSNFIDFIFPNSKQIFDYFSNEPEELKHVNISSFNKDSSGLTSSGEEITYVEKTLYQQPNRSDGNHWLDFLTKLKHESDLEKEREVTKKIIQRKITLKFFKKNNEIFYVENSQNDINYHLFNNGYELTIETFVEHLLDKSYKDSIFNNEKFLYDTNGNFEVELNYELHGSHTSVSLPVLIENSGFSKYEIIHSTLFFLKNFFSPLLEKEFSKIYSKEIIDLKIEGVGIGDYVEKKMYIKLMKNDWSISANRPRLIVSKFSTTGKNALKFSIISFLNTLVSKDFEKQIFDNDEIVYSPDGVFEVELPFNYNVYEVKVSPTLVHQIHGFSKIEIKDNIFWLATKFLGVEFTKEEIEQYDII